MKTLGSLSSIIDKYDLWLLDLWGVVHDGSHLYPGVEEALALLKKENKKVIFISNAPRRSHRVKAVLGDLGVMENCYLDAVSSGEVGYQWLASGKAPWGKKYFYIGPSKDADVLDGLDYVRVDDIKECDFLLNVGFGSEEQTTADFSMLLRGSQKLALPMLCLNPDLEVVKITGHRFPCAGVIGREYERLGGKVTWFGKPYAAIYDYCLSEAVTPKNRILAVGDSLETDIPGGQNYGVDTLLITGGILKHHSETQVREMCEKLGLRPHYIASAFN
jgi:HAD superfamily hydrolase (TIGR01459 family)